MEDYNIVKLFWDRSEEAIKETSHKYANYCYRIAHNILSNEEDAEECVNDTYLNTWNSIPSHRPEHLSTYLGKITRNLAINRYKKRNSAKNGGGNLHYVLDELNECLPSNECVEDKVDEECVKEIINHFLYTISKEECNVFIRRYWYADSIFAISERYSLSASKVKSMLYRTRKKLKQYLEKEDIII